MWWAMRFKSKPGNPAEATLAGASSQCYVKLHHKEPSIQRLQWGSRESKKRLKKKTGGESKSKRLRNPSTGFRKWHHCFFSEWCGWSYSTVSTTGYQTFKAVHRLQSNSCKSAPSNKQSNSLLLQFSIRHYSIKDGQFMVSLCSISWACSF